MAQYTKHNSNYIKTNIHQKLKDGSTIFERDWVTIGSQLHFGPGKIPYYTNGNFIFTTSPTPHYQKRYKNGVAVGLWTYEDVKNATNVVNKINNDEYTEDIRTYVYYGSCLELVRSSIEHIISNFPGNITVSDTEIDIKGQKYYVLNNPFGIILNEKEAQLTQYDNELRYLSYSWYKYEICNIKIDEWESGKEYHCDIVSHEGSIYRCIKDNKEDEFSKCYFEKVEFEKWKPDNEYNEGDRVFHENSIWRCTVNNTDQTDFNTDYFEELEIKAWESNTPYVCDRVFYNGSIWRCIENNTEQDVFSEEYFKRVKKEEIYDDIKNNLEAITSYEITLEKPSNCVKELDKVYKIEINKDKENKIVIEAYIYNGEIVPVVSAEDKRIIVIQPKKDYIENYFNNLQGFEKQLLTRKTKPLYSNTFITPIEYNLGYLYYKRTYTWPSNDYCIDITSTTYMDFLNKLTSMAEIYDELWTDNLWRRMTHEAIKNYDWTYTKEFEDGEEQDNIDGGERMHKVLNIIGRVLDDVKQNIDLIKRNNRITYSADRNIPNALLSDKLELMGWDAYSTISTYTIEETVTDENGNEQTIEREIPASEVKIDDEFLENNEINWYETKNNNELTFTDVDVNFMRKMLLSSKYILKTKGTRAAIDMVMGMFGYGLNGEDYNIIETYRKVKPKMYDYSEGAEEEVFGDKIVRLNAYKENERIYPDDEVSGIPVGSFKVQTNIDDICVFTTYLIPYYDQRKMYDGDFTFQSKGGWIYQGDEEGNQFKWTETLSYLHVVSTIKDLLDVNPNSVTNGDIYYVSNLNDYIDYTEEDTLKSNFFVLNNDFAPDMFSSWENIDLNDTNNENAERAKYLDSIILDTLGNNPHVGFGGYDKGKTYFEYMKKPFKYAIDRNFFSYEDMEEAKDIKFDVDEKDTEAIKSSDKIKIFADQNDINLDGDIIPVYRELTKVSYINIYKNDKSLTEEEYENLTTEEEKRQYRKYAEYNKNAVREAKKNIYYLNSKVVYFENKIDNEQYKKYFKNVIMKYLMQVIPSTTILILQGFE